MSAIPTAADDLTAERLTDILRSADHDAEVTSVSAEPVGTGQMAGSYRIRLTYAEASPTLPDTMIAKMATGPQDQRDFACGAFRNEVGFYQDLASTFRVPVPRHFGSVISPTGAEFVLLLEDMADARQGDQIAGCTPAQAESVAIAAAGLHGPRWNDADLIDRFPLPTDDDRALMESVLEPMAQVYRDRFAPVGIDDGAVEWLVAQAGDWLVTPQRSVALVHGDLRIDNVLFGADDTVTIIDWQTIVSGNPLRDIAFLLSTSLTVDDRRAHERRIVAAYHDALLSHGVSGYSPEECWDDYVANLIQGPLIVVFGSAAAQPTPRGDTMFETMLHRSATAIDDLVASR